VDGVKEHVPALGEKRVALPVEELFDAVEGRLRQGQSDRLGGDRNDRG
jgi:hypothetical protein